MYYETPNIGTYLVLWNGGNSSFYVERIKRGCNLLLIVGYIKKNLLNIIGELQYDK